MIDDTALNPQELNQKTTEELKQELLQLTQNKDSQPLKQKVQFYQEYLAPIVTELSQRNPFPQVEEQVPLILGVWKSVFSTIPFQDSLPGRLPEQSYQIFHDNGFYANMARYAPGNKLKFGWLQKLASVFLAFDLMIVQKYQIKEDEWLIENIAIKQALRWQGIPLSIEKADNWFTKVVKSYSQNTETANTYTQVELKNLDSSTAKKYKTALGATPEFEHLYIDNDFRVVRSRRQAKQRNSYTIAVRIK
ncbi:hypothetical protein [Rivularia sp. UHCC 0363]|uniref:hypothetical protein n=1 Tax=Rivularia sp. UHCC 0363 TaxID=3110244 RepID=UPI002B218473|nr:hypothetical protein [Rivularia sp. UHCC 0363]MEA5598512.1 hypothetical protein [Rivularia sp. UHCC 0363]